MLTVSCCCPCSPSDSDGNCLPRHPPCQAVLCALIPVKTKCEQAVLHVLMHILIVYLLEVLVAFESWAETTSGCSSPRAGGTCWLQELALSRGYNKPRRAARSSEPTRLLAALQQKGAGAGGFDDKFKGWSRRRAQKGKEFFQWSLWVNQVRVKQGGEGRGACIS